LQPVTAGAARRTSAATNDPEVFRDIGRKSRPPPGRLTSPKAGCREEHRPIAKTAGPACWVRRGGVREHAEHREQQRSRATSTATPLGKSPVLEASGLCDQLQPMELPQLRHL
jgi:hypothetical protein